MASSLDLIGFGTFSCFAACVCIACIRTALVEWRQRRELPVKIKLQALTCPLCDGFLPPWEGVFGRCPHEFVAEVRGIYEGPGAGSPEGSFRLYCHWCQRDVWLSAWLDGTVRPHLGWLFEATRRWDEGAGDDRGPSTTTEDS